MQQAGYTAPASRDAPNYPSGAPAPGLASEAVKNHKTGIDFTPGAAGDTTPRAPAAPVAPATPGIGGGRGIETNRADSAPRFADGGMVGENDRVQGYDLSQAGIPAGAIESDALPDPIAESIAGAGLDKSGLIHSLLASSAFAQRSSAGVSRFAEGGKIQGPGAGTGDSIPAVNTDTGEPLAVSTGEVIIPADVVQALGPDFFNELIKNVHTHTKEAP